MNKLGAYWYVALSSAREDGANPARIVSSVLQTLGRTLLVIAVYQVAYKVSGVHNSLEFSNAIWTIGLCFAYFLSLGVRNVARLADADIRTGAVEVALIKPLDWRMMKMCQILGKSMVEFVIQLVALSIMVWLIVGPPHIAPDSAPLFWAMPVLLILSVITAGALFLTVGLSAFWLNDAMPVFRIVDKLALVCCGTFVPLALMPPVMQHIVRYSPFGIYAAPTRLFDPTMRQIVVPSIVSGVIWAILTVGLCQFVWWRVSRRIEVNGG